MKKFLRKRHSNILVNIIACAIIFILLTFVFGKVGARDMRTLVVTICISIIMAVSLNISAGSLGEIVLGHAGFMAIGAYIAAIYLIYTGIEAAFLNYIIALILGAVAAGIAGLIVGIPSLRLRGDYLAIVTLGFGEAVRCVLQNLSIGENYSGRITSIPNILKSSNGSLAIGIAVGTTMIVVATIYCFMTTRHGRAIISIREDEIAAEACGIPVTKYKVLAFTVSAVFAGLAGAMKAQTIGQIEPANFNLNESVNYLVMVVFGGLGSYTGAVLSAIFLTFLNNLLIDFNELRMIIYSVVLIIIMIFKPTGLFGIKEFSLRSFIVDFKLYWNSFVAWIKDTPNRFKELPTNLMKRLGIHKKKKEVASND